MISVSRTVLAMVPVFAAAAALPLPGKGQGELKEVRQIERIEGAELRFGLFLDGKFVGSDMLRPSLGELERGGDREMIRRRGDDHLSLNFGFRMDEKFYDWIADNMKRPRQCKLGLAAYGKNLTEQARMEFSNALLTELTLPAVAADAKKPTAFIAKFQFGASERKPPSGGKMPQGFAVQKKWLPCNFRLSIANLPMKSVSGVEPLAIRAQTPTPGKIEYPNLTFYLPEAELKGWPVKWEGPEFDATKSEGFHNRAVKYTLFLPDGTPMRAEVNAKSAGAKGKKAKGGMVRVELRLKDLSLKFD